MLESAQHLGCIFPVSLFIIDLESIYVFFSTWIK